MRKIPIIMSTQHPDNIEVPFWKTDEPTARIEASEEVQECLHMFQDLDCDEYMWDWEGKFVDEAVIDRLIHSHLPYFKKNPLGVEKFLTFRIPNVQEERGIRFARAFMAILTAAQAFHDLNLPTPPLFEVILPMTTNAKQLSEVMRRFKNLTEVEDKIFNRTVYDGKTLDMIPLIEGSLKLIESAGILENYVGEYESIWGKKPDYIRPFIARSDPALDAGLFPAILAARGALSEYYRFSHESKIPVYPIIGTGSLLFRGLLSPEHLDRFYEVYGGVKTVTVQSSFRYDHPKQQVQAAIQNLKNNLWNHTVTNYTPLEIEEISTISEHFASPYRHSILEMADTINQLAQYVPKHRERIPHTGHFGYSRKLEDADHESKSLPRAITFTCTLYSLGIPPSLIGTGRALQEHLKNGTWDDLQKYYPGFEKDILWDAQFLNKENLEILAKQNESFKDIQKDIQFLEEILGQKFEPTNRLYRNTTSNVLNYLINKDDEGVKESLVEAAKLRKSLG